jgi:hypothetical protein
MGVVVVGDAGRSRVVSPSQRRRGGCRCRCSRGCRSRCRYAPVEPDRLVGHREGQSDGVIGADDAVLAGGDRGTRLAAAIDGMKGGGLGGGSDDDAQVDVTQVPTRARRTRTRWSRPEGAWCSGGTRRRWRSRRRRSRSWGIPLGQQPDEEDGVDGLGNVGVAEPDLIAAFLAPARARVPPGSVRGDL